MSERRVRIIDVVLHDEDEGFVLATSHALPEFTLITRRDRIDATIPDALIRFLEMQGARSVEVLPVDSQESTWAAIIAHSHQSRSQGATGA